MESGFDPGYRLMQQGLYRWHQVALQVRQSIICDFIQLGDVRIRKIMFGNGHPIPMPETGIKGVGFDESIDYPSKAAEAVVSLIIDERQIPFVEKK